MTETVHTKNLRLVRRMVVISVAMFGFGFALVPLYNVFCAITGINGKLDNEAVAENRYQVDTSREIKVEFLTATNGNTPLEFRSEAAKIKVVPGRDYTVNFFARNKYSKKMVGQAIPSVAPGMAAQYFKKTQCFCFNEQVFDAGEQKTMPVRFVIDPDLPKEIKTVSLAYTFFDISNKVLN